MGRTDEFVFDTKHDRYPVAVHAILTGPDGRVLLMRRTGSIYAEGLLGLPAGHVDMGETPTRCLVREIREELGITLTPADLTPAGVMFRRSLEPRVDIFYATSTWDGSPEIHEPHKCTELVWANPEDLPEGTLDFVDQAITDARAGATFREYGWSTALT